MQKRRPRRIKNCLDTGNCANCSKQILTWTIAGNIFLAILKLAGGTLSGSSGLMADGLQSISCVIASVLIMYGLFISQKERDEHFPYGYGKVEFIAALVVFSILIGLGFFIAISNFIFILRMDTLPPKITGLPIAAASVFLTFMMYRYNLCAGKMLESPGLIANAYQSRADMFSSCAVFLGIIISQFGAGFAVFDRLAALLVGILIVKDSLYHWTLNLKVMIDKAPEPKYGTKIQDIVTEVFPGRPPGFIKLKRTGKKFWIGIGLDFSESVNVGEMELVTNKISKALHNRIDWVGEVDFFLSEAQTYGAKNERT